MHFFPAPTPNRPGSDAAQCEPQLSELYSRFVSLLDQADTPWTGKANTPSAGHQGPESAVSAHHQGMAATVRATCRNTAQWNEELRRVLQRNGGTVTMSDTVFLGNLPRTLPPKDEADRWWQDDFGPATPPDQVETGCGPQLKPHICQMQPRATKTTPMPTVWKQRVKERRIAEERCRVNSGCWAEPEDDAKPHPHDKTISSAPGRVPVPWKKCNIFSGPPAAGRRQDRCISPTRKTKYYRQNFRR